MRITLSGDDQRNVDKAMDIILGVAKNTQTIVRGPVPVPHIPTRGPGACSTSWSAITNSSLN